MLCCTWTGSISYEIDEERDIAYTHYFPEIDPKR